MKKVKSDYDRATEITIEAGRGPNNESERFLSVLEYIMQFGQEREQSQTAPRERKR